MQDLGVAQMRGMLKEFEDKAAGAEWALVYFSGHGVELNGKNWLLPVDAGLARASDPTGATLKQEPFVYGHIPDEDFYFKPPRQSR